MDMRAVRPALGAEPGVPEERADTSYVEKALGLALPYSISAHTTTTTTRQ